jgi:hypothetical protein
MKKIMYLFVIFIFTFVLFSCFSTPTAKPVQTRDYGIYNPSNVPEENLCTIIIDQYIIINRFNDDNKVGWNTTFTEKTVKIPSGVHTFYINYVDRQVMSMGSVPVIGQLEEGNSYLLKGTIIGQRIQYQILLFNDRQEGADVSLNINKLQGNDLSTLSTYIKYVINPTMNEVGNTVKLENDIYILTYRPDLVYTLTDKRTGRTIEGRRGFVMDFTMTNGKTYLFETDITKISSQQFLEGNYQENAQTILVPINCTEREVTYKYEKPIELQGNEIVFTITELR